MTDGTCTIEKDYYDAVPARAALPDAEFKTQLTAIIPQLRAFGWSLAGDRDSGDDLVQETLLKAWVSRAAYQAGTNIRAWTFIILRNLFLSQRRRARFHGEWDEGIAERVLCAPAPQDKQIELGDLNRALQTLPVAQREALILVGAGGFGYEEAAEICGIAVGTIKSRVARGRVALEAALTCGDLPSRTRGPATGGRSSLETVLEQLSAFSRAR